MHNPAGESRVGRINDEALCKVEHELDLTETRLS
jgi:hypothetical protein